MSTSEYTTIFRRYMWLTNNSKVSFWWCRWIRLVEIFLIILWVSSLKLWYISNVLFFFFSSSSLPFLVFLCHIIFFFLANRLFLLLSWFVNHRYARRKIKFASCRGSTCTTHLVVQAIPTCIDSCIIFEIIIF
jgi:hypothetical protein